MWVRAHRGGVRQPLCGHHRQCISRHAAEGPTEQLVEEYSGGLYDQKGTKVFYQVPKRGERGLQWHAYPGDRNPLRMSRSGLAAWAARRLAGETSEVWMDAGQMMTTRASDTQTQTSSQDTQPAWLPHTPSGRTHHSRPRPPCRPPQHTRCQESKQQQTNTDKRQGLTCEARAVCSTSSNLAGREAGREPRDRVGGLVRRDPRDHVEDG